MDFIVLKVNGRDLSKATHEEALEAFRSAKEPIMVEVLRRTSPKTSVPPTMSTESPLTSPGSPTYCDSSTQTEWTGGWESPPVGLFPFSQTSLVQSSNHQMALLDGDVMDHHYDTLMEEQYQEEDVGCEVEYEEITLQRSHSKEKLGLTLLYGSPDEAETDIFVSEIEPESVASKDGRIQEGDQLLQINGIEVHSRDQAVSIFSDSRSEFTLLVARPHLQEEDDTEDQSEELTLGIFSNHVLMEAPEDGGTTDTGTAEIFTMHEKDSGFGRTDESTRNDDGSSSHDEGDGHQGAPNGTLCCEDDEDDSVEQRCASTSTTSLADIRPEPEQEASLSRVQSDASLDREMALLNQEMQTIQLECETLVSRHLQGQQGQWFRCHAGHAYVISDVAERRRQHPPPNPPVVTEKPLDKKESIERWVQSMALEKRQRARLHPHVHLEDKERDTSSAYNTGESSRSTPLTLELSPLPLGGGDHRGSMMSLVSPKLVDKSTQLREADVASVVSCDTCRYCRVLAGPDTRDAPQTSSSSSPARGRIKKLTFQVPEAERPWKDGQRNYVTVYPCATMYTNQANLQHTIWLQQQLFRQALAQEQYRQPSRHPLPTCAPLPSTSSCSYTPSKPSPLLHSAHPPHHHPLTPPASTSSSMVPLGGGGGGGVGQVVAPSDVGPLTYNPSPFSSSSARYAPYLHHSSLWPVKEDDPEVKMEWKVKRRPDGTRYITRRPIRNKLLKERALKIMEERCGLTTDDDAMSELKIGRYWSKEERKRHLERARDRKRKEIMMRAKMASVKERPEERCGGAGDDGGAPILIKRDVPLTPSSANADSHKKSGKRKGGKGVANIDDMNPVQDVAVVHGSKGQSSGTKPPLGLLSVTTV